MSTTIRVSDDTRDRLARLAEAVGRPMTEVVDEAVEALERSRFFDELNSGFARLAADEADWAAVQAERSSEQESLADTSR